METIAAIAGRRPDWQFLIIGGQANDIARWQAATAELTNLEFSGLVRHADVPARLAECDVLLAPYGRTVKVSDGTTEVSRWMSPLKLFEYMALGKPIVASDLPVLREVLSDFGNARLAGPDRPGEWERVISELLSNPKEAAAIARRARIDLERKYSWRCRARAIAEALTT
jgi:glycosyltransferase involved in cell wall biosynthesis